MLPQKSSFFSKLSLDNTYYYMIKDETVTVSNDILLLMLNTKTCSMFIITVRTVDNAEIIVWTIYNKMHSKRFLYFIKN